MPNTASASPAAIAAYYDADLDRVLRDYVYDNIRVRGATKFVLSELATRPVRRVLEVGCGIGSVSHAICESSTRVEAVGVDISEKRVEAARKLFPHPRLRFCVSAMETVPVDGVFDAILMLDVYEHIPLSDRSRFHDVIGRMLSPQGVVLLTTPSPLHQAHLASTNPDALQIVGQIIGAEEIAQLARDVGGTLTSFNYKRVWHTNDYVYSIIERTPHYERPRHERSLAQNMRHKLPDLLTAVLAYRGRRVRAEIVRLRLGVQIS